MDIRPNKHDYYLQIGFGFGHKIKLTHRIKHGFTYTETITMIDVRKNWSQGGYAADKMRSTNLKENIEPPICKKVFLHCLSCRE